jgi:hypothetical protein
MIALTYTSRRTGVSQLLLQPIDKSVPPEPLVSSPDLLFAGAWTHDDPGLIYVDSPPTDVDEIALLRLDGDRTPQRLIARDPSAAASGVLGAASWPTLSPDGRWLAFAYEGKYWEIYVQRFPLRGPRQLLIENGREPVWGRDGRELFYRRAQGVFSVPFDPTTGIATGRAVRLFEGPYVSSGGVTRTYDVTPDGERFVVVKQSDEELSPRSFHVVLNWAEELKRRVPGGR